MPEVVVASFNVHGGVDGYGRPYDVVAACRKLDADVLVLQETWTPSVGEALAPSVADELGYRVEELPMTRARLCSAPAAAVPPAAWGPTLIQRGPYGLRVGERRGPPRRPPRRSFPSVAGVWGLAVLCRVPVRQVTTIDLGQLRRDPARRGAIAFDLDVGAPLRVVGTHLSHLSHGSVLQLARLRRRLGEDGAPTVLAGDMNMWGPLLSSLLPGWSRVVRGRTWPAWRPVAQIDHILVTGGIRPGEEGQVVDIAGSDHLPVRARLEVPPTPTR
ncbi:MAG TPA: endonuclease/exonuclease/phosphatase family protein [Acidimicrobiales bacterium]|nr:endonuclease/exonuclease/phosphatase family protein [Acidimicrobiales bacterium]